MPLDAAGLEADLTAFFAAPPVVLDGNMEPMLPETNDACAEEWADAMESYAQAIVPASATVTSAAAALRTALAAAFALPSAASAFDAAFLAFATAVGGGMAGFTAVPPPAPLNVALLLGASLTSHAAAAASFRSLIDAWMRTGTATPLPSGSPVNWS